MKSLKLLLFPLLALAPAYAEKAVNLPAPTAYVDDYANVMTPAGKARVEAECREVHARTRAQIFVVTIKSLEGEPIAQFANDLFHTWKIGEKKTDRGVLVLLVQDSHRWRIEVGYGLEGILPDAKAGRIGRAMDPSINAGDYDAAAKSSVDAIAGVIAEDANVTLAQPDSSPQVHPLQSPAAGAAGGIFAFFLIGALGVFLLLAYLRRRARMSRGYGAGYVDPGAETSGFIAAPISYGSDTGPSFGSDFGSNSSDSSGGDSFSGGDGGDSGGGGADGGGGE